MYRTPRISLAAVVIVILAIGTRARAEQIGNFWPVVAPLKKSFQISRADKVALQLKIKDNNGKPLYKLECHDGDYASEDFNYAGLIQCRLTSMYSERPESAVRYNALIYEVDPDADWESRARFVEEEVDKCAADYPDWGRVRNFRLRGMDLTLAIDDLKLVKRPFPYFSTGSYRFSVKVEPDPGALSAIEGPFHFAEPLAVNGNANCKRIIPKHVPGEVTDGYIGTHKLRPPYPEILARQADFTFTVAQEEQHSELPIYDSNHEVAYTLRCSTGIWIAGRNWAIGCHLFETGNPIDLLVDAIDLYTRRSRAMFEGAYLTPVCQGYPEWGSSRDFNLRGMKISFVEKGDFENQLWLKSSDDPAVGRKVKLHVEVVPDPLAKNSVAMPINIVDWMLLGRDKACKEVLTR